MCLTPTPSPAPLGGKQGTKTKTNLKFGHSVKYLASIHKTAEHGSIISEQIL